MTQPDIPEDLNTLDFAVFGTQGGGLARRSDDGNDYVWYEVPAEFAEEFKVGDIIPDEWDIQPANEPGRRETVGY